MDPTLSYIFNQNDALMVSRKHRNIASAFKKSEKAVRPLLRLFFGGRSEVGNPGCIPSNYGEGEIIPFEVVSHQRLFYRSELDSTCVSVIL